jgi:hypothetical protein
VTKLGASLLVLAGLLGYRLGFSNKEVSINSQQLIALGVAAVVLSSFIFKECSKYKNRNLSFMKALADNLYFKNLDNNSGSSITLLIPLKKNEKKRYWLTTFLLSWDALWRVSIRKKIEQWFAEQFDFEIAHALAKLVRFGIIKYDNNQYTALPISEAKVKLDTQWDTMFNFPHTSLSE